MAIEGAYEENGLVVIEFSDDSPVRLTWRQAMERCRAIQEAEQSVSIGRRENVQKAIEQTIAAAIEARKKDDPSWKPKQSVSMFTGKQAKKSELNKPKSNIIVANS